MITFNTEQVTKNTTSKDLEALNAGCPEVKLQEKSVEYTQNAEYVVSPDAGYDGLSKVNVSVDLVVPTVQNSKTVNITKNGSTTVKPDTGYDAVEQVVVNTNIPLQEKQVDVLLSEPTTVILPDTGYTGITKLTVNHSPVEANTAYTATSNGQYTIHPSEGFDATTSVNLTVNVPATPVEPTKSVEITQNGTTNIIPADGYDAIAGVDVTVNVPSKEEETKSVSYTSNGSYTVQPTEGKTLSEVSVSVNVTNPPTAYDISNKFVNCVNQTITQEDIDAFTGWENLTDGSYKFYKSKSSSTYLIREITLPEMPKLLNGNNMCNSDPTLKYHLEGKTFKLSAAQNMFRNSRVSVDENFRFVSTGGGYFNAAIISGNFARNAFYIDADSCANINGMFTDATLPSSLSLEFRDNINCNEMFWRCKDLVSLDLTLTGTSLTLKNLLSNITTLQTLNLTLNSDSTIDFGGYSFYSPFLADPSLTNLTINIINDSCWFNDCGLLSQDSVNNIFNALADVTSNPKTLTLSNQVQSYVTEEQKTAATAKGWTINFA